jgi:hypothetical protein
MKQTLGAAALLASAATLAALVATTFPGCDTNPKPITPPVVTNPIDELPPPPQPDVGECVRKIESMQGALSMAKIGAAILVSKDSKYGPAVKVAIAAIDAALANARVQCGSGNIDGWAVALAAFDKAFAELVDAGDEFASAASADTYIPPYAFSLEEWNARVFEGEFESANFPEPVIE